ncbi:MAG: hypothetical protein MK212_05340 [Saprospiraceae bacterium]|nr:hypothetical protein [Saprospiraceae bacterium]
MLLKVLHIFLANLVFLSTSGMTFQKHFCKGKYVSLSVVEQIEICCLPKPKVLPNEKKKRSSCCQLKKNTFRKKRTCCSTPILRSTSVKEKIDYSYSSKCCYLSTDYLHEVIISSSTSDSNLEFCEAADCEPILLTPPKILIYQTTYIRPLFAHKQLFYVQTPLSNSPPKLYLHFQSFLC